MKQTHESPRKMRKICWISLERWHATCLCSLKSLRGSNQGEDVRVLRRTATRSHSVWVRTAHATRKGLAGSKGSPCAHLGPGAPLPSPRSRGGRRQPRLPGLATAEPGSAPSTGSGRALPEPGTRPVPRPRGGREGAASIPSAPVRGGQGEGAWWAVDGLFTLTPSLSHQGRGGSDTTSMGYLADTVVSGARQPRLAP